MQNTEKVTMSQNLRMQSVLMQQRKPRLLMQELLQTKLAK